MRSRFVFGTLVIAATLIGSGTAGAQECKTREQVKAELAEATRAGTILSGDGTLWRDLGAPQRFPTTAFAAANCSPGTLVRTDDGESLSKAGGRTD